MPILDELNLTPWEHIRPASEKVYQALKNNILSGAIPSGTYLTEVSVSTAFHLSRTPVREALRRLENEKLIQNMPRKGLLVQNIRKTDAIALYDLAMLLESYAAELAASNITTQQLELLQILANQEQIPQSGSEENVEEQRLKENYDFHTLIAYASGNSYLVEYILQIRDRMKLLHTADTSSSAPQNAPSHIRIYRAIQEGNGEIASILMKQHIHKAKEKFLRNIK